MIGTKREPNADLATAFGHHVRQHTIGANRREQKRLEAQDRQRLSVLRKPVEARIKRLEEQLARHTARKEELDARLASSDIYDAANKEELKTLLTEQAYCAKEIEQLELEWLEQQEELEKIA